MRTSSLIVIALSTSLSVAAPVALSPNTEAGLVKRLVPGTEMVQGLKQAVSDTMHRIPNAIKTVQEEGPHAPAGAIEKVKEVVSRLKLPESATLEQVAAAVRKAPPKVQDAKTALDMAQLNRETNFGAERVRVLGGEAASASSKDAVGASHWQHPDVKHVPWSTAERVKAVDGGSLAAKLGKLDEEANVKAMSFAEPGVSLNKPVVPMTTPEGGVKPLFATDKVTSWPEPPKVISQVTTSPHVNGYTGQRYQLTADGKWFKYTPPSDAKQSMSLLKVAGTTGGIFLAGALLVHVLGETKLKNGQTVLGSGQVPEEGALAEVDEKRILKFMIAHPEEWKPLMATISTMPNVSKKELDEFNAANPALLQGSTASVGTSDASVDSTDMNAVPAVAPAAEVAAVPNAQPTSQDATNAAPVAAPAAPVAQRRSLADLD